MTCTSVLERQEPCRTRVHRSIRSSVGGAPTGSRGTAQDSRIGVAVLLEGTVLDCPLPGDRALAQKVDDGGERAARSSSRRGEPCLQAPVGICPLGGPDDLRRPGMARTGLLPFPEMPSPANANRG